MLKILRGPRCCLARCLCRHLNPASPLNSDARNYFVVFVCCCVFALPSPSTPTWMRACGNRDRATSQRPHRRKTDSTRGWRWGWGGEGRMPNNKQRRKKKTPKPTEKKKKKNEKGHTRTRRTVSKSSSVSDARVTRSSYPAATKLAAYWGSFAAEQKAKASPSPSTWGRLA